MLWLASCFGIERGRESNARIFTGWRKAVYLVRSTWENIGTETSIVIRGKGSLDAVTEGIRQSPEDGKRNGEEVFTRLLFLL